MYNRRVVSLCVDSADYSLIREKWHQLHHFQTLQVSSVGVVNLHVPCYVAECGGMSPRVMLHSIIPQQTSREICTAKNAGLVKVHSCKFLLCIVNLPLRSHQAFCRLQANGVKEYMEAQGITQASSVHKYLSPTRYARRETSKICSLEDHVPCLHSRAKPNPCSDSWFLGNSTSISSEFPKYISHCSRFSAEKVCGCGEYFLLGKVKIMQKHCSCMGKSQVFPF